VVDAFFQNRPNPVWVLQHDVVEGEAQHVVIFRDQLPRDGHASIELAEIVKGISRIVSEYSEMGGLVRYQLRYLL